MVKSLAFLMAIATTALAQSTTTTTTANVITTSLFLAATTPATFVASIIGADKSSTIYALNCQDCGDTSTVTQTVTEQGSTFLLSAASMISSVNAQVMEKCIVTNTTEAACTATIMGAEADLSASTAITATLTGSNVVFNHVLITAGAAKLAAASTATAATSSSSTAKPKSAASSLSHGGSKDSMVMMVAFSGAAVLLGALMVVL